MYITCEQCSTVYRLDEKLLKRTGSKVRCSHCRYIFIAQPPDGSLDEAEQPESAGQPEDQMQAALDQELEGINVDELDSILEQGRTTDANVDTAVSDGMDDVIDEEPVEFNEADLDMDFEAAFDQEEDISEPADTPVQPSDQTSEPQLEDLSDEIDLDMDFELDDDEVFDQPSISEDDDLDLDMEFDLDDTSQNRDAIEPPDEHIPAQSDHMSDEEKMVPDSDDMLDEDVDLALDDFEDVLGDAVGTKDEGLLDVEAEDIDVEVEIDDMPQLSNGADVEDALQVAEVDSVAEDEDKGGIDPTLDEAAELSEVDAPGAKLNLDTDEAAISPNVENDDLGLSDLGAFLDEEDDDEPEKESELEDIELSLDDDFKLDLEQESVSEQTSEESVTTAAPTSKDDDIADVDLARLDDLLGVDDEIDKSAVSSGQDIELDEELELSLDGGAVLDDVPDESDAAAVVTESTADEELELSALDDFLDEDQDPVGDAVSEKEAPGLDDDLELSLDEDAVLDDISADETKAAALTGETHGDNVDLAAGLDDLLDEDETPSDALDDEDRELSLEEELDLSLDEEPHSEPDEVTIAQTDHVDRNEFDLSDFEDLLVDEQAEVAEQDDQAPLSLDSDSEAVADGADDFDMSQLGDFLDEEQTADQSQQEDSDFELDDELELSLADDGDLELGSDDTQTPVTSEEDADDLELTGMDDLLEEETSDSSKIADSDIELSFEDDMELSLDEDATKALEEDGGELEDLEFDLDEDFKDKSIALEKEVSEDDVKDEESQSDAADESLDLSDIEKMLEEDNIVPEVSSATQGLTDTDLGDLGEADDLGLDEDEFDLSEIEEAIDSLDEEDSDASFVDGARDQDLDLELDLDLDLESEDLEGVDTIDDFELELEMEDSSAPAATDHKKDGSDALEHGLDSTVEEGEKAILETETVDGGDIQLEFSIEEDGAGFETEENTAAAESAAAAATGITQMQDGDDFSVEETIAAEPIGASAAPGVVKAPKPKTRSKAILILILILLLLAVGGYVGYNYVVKNNIQIPFLSNYMNPQAKDPSGIQQLATMQISSKFIENNTEGRLFVITGKVKNNYSTSRKVIRLRGKLYTKGKVLAKTAQATAGLMLTEQELLNQPMAEIKKGLTSTMGKDSTVTVAAGNSAPFMVVFSDLPADLDEFVIELVDSSKAQ
jgi:predicted Zn finger-like uncharacterized protein